LPQVIKVFETEGDGALVSTLENGTNTFFVVVNRSLEKSMPFILFGDNSLKKVLKDGTIVPAADYAAKNVLDPGDIAVYMFPTPKIKAQ
jgi:hypothetical protein